MASRLLSVFFQRWVIWRLNIALGDWTMAMAMVHCDVVMLMSTEGNDGDTLGSDTVLVYDTSDFPAHVVAWLWEGKGDLWCWPIGDQSSKISLVKTKDSPCTCSFRKRWWVWSTKHCWKKTNYQSWVLWWFLRRKNIRILFGWGWEISSISRWYAGSLWWRIPCLSPVCTDYPVPWRSILLAIFYQLKRLGVSKVSCTQSNLRLQNEAVSLCVCFFCDKDSCAVLNNCLRTSQTKHWQHTSSCHWTDFSAVEWPNRLAAQVKWCC